MRGPMIKNWEKGKMSAHCMEASSLNVKAMVAWLVGKKNELIRVPGMESILHRRWLSRTESTAFGVCM